MVRPIEPTEDLESVLLSIQDGDVVLVPPAVVVPGSVALFEAAAAHGGR